MPTIKAPSTPGIAARLVPGAPIPQPTRTSEWLDLGRALDAEIRAGFHVPAGADTVAVGWTSIQGLRARRFVGGSRRIREAVALPTASPHLMAPRSNAQFLDHAEQDVANAFIDAVSGLRHKPDLSSHWLRIYVSHSQGPCAACAQGLAQRQVDPGVLGQLSRMYPDLLIHLFWQTAAGGLGSLMIENGARLE